MKKISILALMGILALGPGAAFAAAGDLLMEDGAGNPTSSGISVTDVTNAWNNAQDYMDDALGYDSTSEYFYEALTDQGGSIIGGSGSVLGALVDLESSTVALESTVATNSSDISTLRSDVNTISGDVSTLRTDVNNNAANIANETNARISADAALSGRLDTNTADIGLLRSDVGTIAGDVGVLRTDVNNNANNIATNTTAIATNKANIATNTANIGNMSLLNPAIDAGNLVGSLNNTYQYAFDEVTRLDGRVDGLVTRVDGVDCRIDAMGVEMRSALAGAAALSALVPNARGKGDTSLSFGAGTYRDQYGIAAGAFHYINDNVLLNAGASYAHENFSGRVGVTFSW